MTSTDTAHVMRIFSGLFGAAAKVLPGPVGMVSGVLAEGLGMGADFAAGGHDAPVMMRQIRDRATLLKDADREVEDAFRKKFGEDL